MFEHYLAALLSLGRADDLASLEWAPCPCGRWGVVHADRHGCVAPVKKLFAELDRELDAWEAAHGWLYR
jgi:hypothetical protein